VLRVRVREGHRRELGSDRRHRREHGRDRLRELRPCFGEVEDPACGKALQFEQFCYNIACNECTTTSTERQKCVETAGASGMCTTFGDETAKACPNIQTSAKKCNSIIDAAKTLCTAGSADAGKG